MRTLFLDLEGQLKVMEAEENTMIFPEEERAMRERQVREMAEKQAE